MAVGAVPEETLDMKSCSIFFHLLVDTLCLVLIADESPPRLLDCDCCRRPLDYVVHVENEGLLKVLQEAQHFTPSLLDLEL